MKPYSTRVGNGRYSLFVSPQWLDATQSGIGMVPVIGWGFSILNWIAQRTIGGYDIKGTIGSVIGIGDYVNNKVVKNISKWAGKALNVLEAIEYGYDWLYTHSYQMEEAIYNHFDRNIWNFSNRNIVDKKFEFAMNKMATLMLEGKVGVAKAIDY